MTTICPALQPGPRLLAMLKGCEVLCVAECCGIDAFDITPLHAAAHLCRPTGVVRQEDVTAIESELEALLALAEAAGPNDQAFVCSISGLNQYFTRDSMSELATQVRRALALAPLVFAFAESLDVDSLATESS